MAALAGVRPEAGAALKPPIPYYGGKSRIADWIVGLMPAHDSYVELFSGSASVLFAKAPSTHEILNDLDSSVVTFFRVLREQPAELVQVCRLTPYAREEFLAADLTEPGLSDLEHARRFFVRVTQGFSRATGRQGNVGWSISIAQNTSAQRHTANLLERFVGVAARLQRVAIDNRPAVECVERYGRPGVVLYADPPYLDETRSSLHHRPRGDYTAEYHRPDDHRELAAALRATPATVFLSGYPSDLYDELFGDWHRIERSVFVSSSNRSRQRKRALEVVWSNRPIGGRLELHPHPKEECHG